MFVRPKVNWCLMILVLTGSDFDVMVGCVALNYVQ